MYVIHSNNNKASRIYFLKYDLLDEIIEAVTVTMKHHTSTHMSLLGDNNINIYTIFSILSFPQKTKTRINKNYLLNQIDKQMPCVTLWA